MISGLRRLLSRARSIPVTTWLETAVITAAMAFMVRTLDPVFTTGGHQGPLVMATILASLLALTLWFFDVRTGFALVVGLMGYFAFAAYAIYSDSLTAGLPLLDTANEVWDGATGGWSDLLSTPAPAEPIDPLLAAPVFVMWWGGFLAVLLLARARPSTFALLPLAATWMALLILGPGHRASLSATIVVVAASMVFLALNSISVGAGSRGAFAGDLPTVATEGRRRVYRNAVSQAAPLVAVLVILSVLMANRTSLVDDATRTDLRERFVPTVQVQESVTPLARVRAQLSAAASAGDEGAEVFSFVVTTGILPDSGILYLRSTALDDFDDGALWRATGDYARVGSILTPTESGPGPILSVDIDLTNAETRLGQNRWLGPYLPSPGEAQSIGGVAAAYNRVTGTLIRAAASATPDGYSVTGTLPASLDDVSLESSSPGLTAELLPLLFVPDLSEEFEDTLLRFREEADVNEVDTPVETLLKLRDAMQGPSFGRDIQRAHGHSLAAVNRYLATAEIDEARRGVSEQSASAMAVLARREGLPSRVAVGYRVDVNDEASEGDDGRTVVRTSHARAWAEVFLDQFGWIAVDPVVDRASTLAPPEPPAQIPESDSSDDEPDQAEAAEFIPVQTTTEPRTLTWWPFPLAVVALALAAIPIAKLGRRRQRIAETEPRRAVIAAWDETRDALVDHGLVVKSSATEADVAFGAGSLALTRENEALTQLATLTASARWAHADPQSNATEQAWDHAAEIAHDMRSNSSAGMRAKAMFSTRSLTGNLGRSHGRRNPASRPDAFDALHMGNEQQTIGFDEFIESLEADRTELLTPAASGERGSSDLSEQRHEEH